MTNTPHTWVAMTVVTVPAPASIGGRDPAERHLAGIGLFMARQDDGRWRFTRHTHAVPAGEPAGALLEGVADRLPAEGTLIGWHVDHRLMPVLLDAAAIAPPVVAHHFTARLYRLLRGGVVDLALGHGSAPLAVIAAGMAIHAPARDADAVPSASGSGQVDRLRRDLADETLALWRVFVRSAGLAGLDAEAATDAWIAHRQRLRVVKRGS